MKLAFVLSMPAVASWNGKWSGEGKLYVVVRSFGASVKGRERAQKALANAPYLYRWDDGWIAQVDVREVEPQEARRLTKASSGFCGYEWMIESILSHGKIYAGHEVPNTAATAA